MTMNLIRANVFFPPFKSSLYIYFYVYKDQDQQAEENTKA